MLWKELYFGYFCFQVCLLVSQDSFCLNLLPWHRIWDNNGKNPTKPNIITEEKSLKITEENLRCKTILSSMKILTCTEVKRVWVSKVYKVISSKKKKPHKKRCTFNMRRNVLSMLMKLHDSYFLSVSLCYVDKVINFYLPLRFVGQSKTKDLAMIWGTFCDLVPRLLCY